MYSTLALPEHDRNESEDGEVEREGGEDEHEAGDAQ